MREFVTAAKAEAQVIEKFPFVLDGVTYHAYPPTEAQVAMIVAIEAGAYTSEEEKVAGFINFTFDLFDDDTKTALGKRLLDRDDDFDLEDLSSITEALIEEASQTPTKPSSASTPQSAKPGRSSTGTARKAAAIRSA